MLWFPEKTQGGGRKTKRGALGDQYVDTLGDKSSDRRPVTTFTDAYLRSTPAVPVLEIAPVTRHTVKSVQRADVYGSFPHGVGTTTSTVSGYTNDGSSPVTPAIPRTVFLTPVQGVVSGMLGDPR